jgi:PAS domain S-box-containing protein
LSLDDKRGDEADLDFREVVNNLVDGVLVTNGDGKILFVNPSYCSHLGIEPEDVLGRNVFEIANEGLLFRHSVSADVIRSRRRISGAGYMRTVNGRRVNGYATGLPVFDSNGELRFVVSSLTDIDELRTRFDQFRGTDRAEVAIQIYDSYTTDREHELGDDPNMKAVAQKAAELAATNCPILIKGEAGVGKEVLADFILAGSDRSGAPYVKVNCAAIPEHLLESELFGAVGGERAGLLELSSGGTLLLGEIDSLPQYLQEIILDIFKSRRILHDNGDVTELDIRIIAAAGSHLSEKVESGEFLRGLYDFFGGNVLDIPPLRERKVDIMPMAKRFFDYYCAKHGRELRLPESARAGLEGYSWPENVRELKNIMEYIVICSEGDELDIDKLAELLDIPVSGRPHELGLHEAVAQYEKQMIEQALKECGGVRRAAAYLKVDPSTISRKARKYGIPLMDQQP